MGGSSSRMEDVEELERSTKVIDEKNKPEKKKKKKAKGKSKTIQENGDISPGHLTEESDTNEKMQVLSLWYIFFNTEIIPGIGKLKAFSMSLDE